MTQDELAKLFKIDGLERKSHKHLYVLILIRIAFFLLYFGIGYILADISHVLFHNIMGYYNLVVAFLFGIIVTRYISKYIGMAEYLILLRVGV